MKYISQVKEPEEDIGLKLGLGLNTSELAFYLFKSSLK